MLKDEFCNCSRHFTSDTILTEKLWLRIETAYSSSSRYYHTLTHLNAILAELNEYRGLVEDWSTIVFAISYHDLVYDATATDNEERSSALAAEDLALLKVDAERIHRCQSLIIATKKHGPADHQTNLFTDADLSILGASPAVYAKYAEDIRMEYQAYADEIYFSGRKRVIKHFLEMPQIFKTKQFRYRYETAARVNLSHELSLISLV